MFGSSSQMKIINTADDKAIYGKWAGTEYAKQLERKKHPTDTTAVVERLVRMKKPTNSISAPDWAAGAVRFAQYEQGVRGA
jgi:hypothetical protein